MHANGHSEMGDLAGISAIEEACLFKPCCSDAHSKLNSYMVVDLKVLVSSVYDDDPEHIKISFGERFFSSWRKYSFFGERSGERL